MSGKLTAEQLGWQADQLRMEAELRSRRIRAHVTRLDVVKAWDEPNGELLRAVMERDALFSLAGILANEADPSRSIEQSRKP